MTPYLLNMSDDVSLAGCLMYPLQLNERTSIGSDPDNTVVVHGLGVLPWLGETIFHNVKAKRWFGVFFFSMIVRSRVTPVQNLWHLAVWHHNIPDYLVGLPIELHGLLQLFNARTCLFTWHPFDAQHPCRPCLWIGKVDKKKLLWHQGTCAALSMWMISNWRWLGRKSPNDMCWSMERPWRARVWCCHIMTAFVTLAVLSADKFGCFMIVQSYLLGPCLMPLCHTVPCGWGFGRAQMLKVHIPRHGVETIQESEELEHAMTGLKRLEPWNVKDGVISNMSRPQWKCNWATHAMDMRRRMSKSWSELGCQVLDLYRCFIMRKLQLYWRISPFDRDILETFRNHFLFFGGSGVWKVR